MSRFKDHELGFQWSHGDFFVFFGNQKANPEGFKRLFPHLDMFSIKQVHGERVVKAGAPTLEEADAHYSQEPFKALQIKTADCIPMFVVDQVQKHVLAIHAGWRGVASLIAVKAIHQLIKLGGRCEDLRVVIGPHIRRQSFEIEEPVLVQLIDSIPVDQSHNAHQFYDVSGPGKFKVDLEGIIKAQLLDVKIPAESIESLDIDTLTSPAWHSFRRDREQAGRNISFVVRLEG